MNRFGQFNETVESDDGLSCETYCFTQIECVIYLDKYLVSHRETKRHKFRISRHESYSRLSNREYTLFGEPDIPFEIEANAVNYFRSQVTFKKWMDK